MGESCLSPVETLAIVSSFNSGHHERVNCHSCLYRPGKSAQLIMQDREIKGCFSPRNDVVFQTDVKGLLIKYYDCIGNHTTPVFPYLFSWYKNAKDHGYNVWETPAKLVDIYTLIDTLMGDHLRERKQAK